MLLNLSLFTWQLCSLWRTLFFCSQLVYIGITYKTMGWTEARISILDVDTSDDNDDDSGNNRKTITM